MKKGRVLLSLMVSQISACGLPPIVEMPPTPILPEAFGTFSIALASDGNCPEVAGKFLSPPEVITVAKGEQRHSRGSRIDIYSIFPAYLATAQLYGVQRESNEPGLLVVEQPSKGTLIIQEATMSNRTISSFELIQSEGDFDCESGFIRFPATSHYGVGEDVTLNGQSVEQIRLTQEGDLVGINIWGPFRSRSKSAQSKFVHEFYRFERIDK